jgi:hypothetical protein
VLAGDFAGIFINISVSEPDGFCGGAEEIVAVAFEKLVGDCVNTDGVEDEPNRIFGCATEEGETGEGLVNSLVSEIVEITIDHVDCPVLGGSRELNIKCKRGKSFFGSKWVDLIEDDFA